MMEDWLKIPRFVSLWGREERLLFFLLLTEADEEGTINSSIRELSEVLGVSRKRVDSILAKLEASHLVSHLVSHLGVVVSICDYERYLWSPENPEPLPEPLPEPPKEKSPLTNPKKENTLFYKKKSLSIDKDKKESSPSTALPPAGNEPSPQPPSLENRRSKFYNSLVPYVGKYPKEMIRDFYDYWSETDRGVKPKMRFEKQTSWELSKRLARWERNNRPRGVATAHAASRLDQYKEIARQIGIYQDGTEQSDTVDEQ